MIDITSPEFYGTKLDTVLRQPPKDQTDQNTPAKTKVKPDIYTFGRFQLYSFGEEQKKQYLTASDRKAAGSMLFALARPADTSVFKLSIIDTPDSAWFMEHNDLRDTFKIWIVDQTVFEKELLEALVTYPFTDSTNTLIYRSDTVKMRFMTKAVNPRAGGSKKSPLTFTTNTTAVVKPGTIPVFEGTFPVYMPDTSRIIFLQTVDTVKTKLKPVFLKDEGNSRKFSLVTPLIPGASYSMICKKGSFSDIYGHKSDSIAYKFRVAIADDYGSLAVNISGYEGKIIVQLLTQKETVAQQKLLTSPGQILFSLIDKGKYRLKVIYDLDGNGKWTTGSFTEKRMPEPVSFFPAELEERINWSDEQDWDISIRNSKDILLRSKPEAKSKSR